MSENITKPQDKNEDGVVASGAKAMGIGAIGGTLSKLASFAFAFFVPEMTNSPWLKRNARRIGIAADIIIAGITNYFTTVKALDGAEVTLNKAKEKRKEEGVEEPRIITDRKLLGTFLIEIAREIPGVNRLIGSSDQEQKVNDQSKGVNQ